MAKEAKTESGKEPTGKEIRLPSKITMREFNEALTDYVESVEDARDILAKAQEQAVAKQLLAKPFKLAKKLYDDVKAAKNESIAAEKLAQFLAHFDEARKFFKLDELANLQGRMFAEGPINGKPPRERDVDGEPDMRPDHLRQPGASAASVVQDLAAKTGAKTSDDPLSKVGRGPAPDTKH